MVFITQFSARHESLAAGWRRLWYALVFGLCSGMAHADGFEVRTAGTYLKGDHYQLTARIDYNFSTEMLDALDNGVPLTLHLEIEVQRVRSWWADQTLTRLERRYQLTYHAFSSQYLLRDLLSAELSIHPTLNQALTALGSLDDLPLVNAAAVAPDEKYQVQLRTSLDIEALPAPLRPVAYITPGWRKSSEWYTCSLMP